MPGVKFAFCCCDKQDGLTQLSGQWNFSVVLQDSGLSLRAARTAIHGTILEHKQWRKTAY